MIRSVIFVFFISIAIIQCVSKYQPTKSKSLQIPTHEIPLIDTIPSAANGNSPSELDHFINANATLLQNFDNFADLMHLFKSKKIKFGKKTKRKYQFRFKLILPTTCDSSRLEVVFNSKLLFHRRQSISHCDRGQCFRKKRKTFKLLLDI